MIQGINGFQNIQGLQGGQGYSVEQRQKVKEEFMAIFYKELLKQSFKPGSFGVEKDSSTFFNSFGKDMLVEKLALELARKKAFSVDALFPSAVERSRR